MVLQRAPQAAIIWGFTTPNSTVTTMLLGGGLPVGGVAGMEPMISTADVNGTWRQALPPTAAGGPHTITVKSSAGESATMKDVLFGDVFLCGG
jgi:sialate O-acetylesterase